jgi:hypothetical protein
MSTWPDRIEDWQNTQLSIARFYGGIKINGAMYLIEKETGDLVKMAPAPRKKKQKA